MDKGSRLKWAALGAAILLAAEVIAVAAFSAFWHFGGSRARFEATDEVFGNPMMGYAPRAEDDDAPPVTALSMYTSVSAVSRMLLASVNRTRSPGMIARVNFIFFTAVSVKERRRNDSAKCCARPNWTTPGSTANPGKCPLK